MKNICACVFLDPPFLPQGWGLRTLADFGFHACTEPCTVAFGSSVFKALDYLVREWPLGLKGRRNFVGVFYCWCQQYSSAIYRVARRVVGGKWLCVVEQLGCSPCTQATPKKWGGPGAHCVARIIPVCLRKNHLQSPKFFPTLWGVHISSSFHIVSCFSCTNLSLPYAIYCIHPISPLYPTYITVL